MKDANPESIRQERTALAAPCIEFGPRPDDLANVIATVVVDHEQAPIRSKDPVHLGEVSPADISKRGPQPDHDVHRCARGEETEGACQRLVGEASPEGDEACADRAPIRVDQQDVAIGNRTEIFDAVDDLRLAVEGGFEACREGGAQRDRQDGHGRSIGGPASGSDPQGTRTTTTERAGSVAMSVPSASTGRTVVSS